MPLPTVLLAMVAAQLFDLGTFLTMVHRLGPVAEANPIVAEVLSSGGLGVVVLAKLALVVLVGAVAVVLTAVDQHRARRLGGALLAFAIVAGVVGGWTNAMTMGPL
jgi:hypothetical protein